MTTEQHTCEVIEQLVEALTDPESQPNQFGVVFGMRGPRMFFTIGNQSFDLAYEPDSTEEFEFMKRMLCSAFSTFTPDVRTAPAPSTAGERAQVVEIDTSQERVDKTAGNGDMVPLSAIRPIAVEAIRAVTGCPDIRGNDKYLVDEIEDIAKHAALLQSTAHHIGDANKMVAALPVGELTTGIAHSLAGFRGAFESEYKRKPTEQEIWNAAIRSWRDITRQKSDSAKELEEVIADLLMYAGDNGYGHIDYADTMRHAAALLSAPPQTHAGSGPALSA